MKHSETKAGLEEGGSHRVDVEDGDEADSSRLQKLAAQVCGFPCICICWKPPAFYFSFKLLCSQICWHHM